MNNIYWIGPRQSDIETSTIIKNSITIYGDNLNNNIAYCQGTNRINHNIDNEDCEQFIKSCLLNILSENSEAKFLFYNQAHAYKYGKRIQAHSIGINNRNLIEILSDKARCRYLLSDIVDTIPFITVKGSECKYNTFHNCIPSNEFVVQQSVSSGGDGTYHITNSDYCEEIFQNNRDTDYLVSPYLSNALSINVHIIVCENNILVFPGSIQITCEIRTKILYSGADFICYESLSTSIKQKVNATAHKIANYLKNKGYRGILGIDFLLQDDKLYFMELNPRFQASSELINRTLKHKHQKSLQELHLLSFTDWNEYVSTDFCVNYSNFVYTTQNVFPKRLKKIFSSSEVFQLQTDGYNINDNLFSDDNIYLCRCIFEKNICSIVNEKLLLHPNIYTEKLNSYMLPNSTHFNENVKFALLNHGVTLSPSAQIYAQQFGKIKKAVFDAIDITIFNTVRVNVPISCKFNSISPFTIEQIADKFILFFENYEITQVTIDFVPDCLIGMETSSGVPYDAIINLATDRIRINPAPICIYKREKLSCEFCNLPEYNFRYDLNDIKEVIDYCLKNISFRHFLIGGGTFSHNGGWDIILQITKYIRRRSSKDIYLMSIPPEDVNILDSLKEAGITEVAFNLEIFNRNLACKIMPGKGKLPIERYIKTFEHAVSLWGNSGKVRTLLIYGFDNEDDFLDGINKLCSRGIEPIISIFRPLAGTKMENFNPPSTVDIFSIYIKCKDIAEKYSLMLGPDCPACQNNTLSYTP